MKEINSEGQSKLRREADYLIESYKAGDAAWLIRCICDWGRNIYEKDKNREADLLSVSVSCSKEEGRELGRFSVLVPMNQGEAILWPVRFDHQGLKIDLGVEEERNLLGLRLSLGRASRGISLDQEIGRVALSRFLALCEEEKLELVLKMRLSTRNWLTVKGGLTYLDDIL